MSTTHAHSLASFGTPIGAGGLLHNFGALFAARRGRIEEQARIRRELSRYTDRELGDLGLSRSDIEAVASGDYRR